MKTFIQFFLTDSNKSMTRLAFFIDIVACIIIGIISIILNRNSMETAALIGALLAPVSVAKFMQSKFEENNSEK
jgi:NhaP-type Na+/H+ or K+/H+ antiporter